MDRGFAILLMRFGCARALLAEGCDLAVQPVENGCVSRIAAGVCLIGGEMAFGIARREGEMAPHLAGEALEHFVWVGAARDGAGFMDAGMAHRLLRSGGGELQAELGHPVQLGDVACGSLLGLKRACKALPFYLIAGGGGA
jgi:hypothetical protein